jgi:hypothetical protein
MVFVIGIKVAAAGRWHGLLRVSPAVAESWVVVVLPVTVVLGATAGGIVSGLHLLARLRHPRGAARPPSR